MNKKNAPHAISDVQDISKPSAPIASLLHLEKLQKLLIRGYSAERAERIIELDKEKWKRLCSGTKLKNKNKNSAETKDSPDILKIPLFELIDTGESAEDLVARVEAKEQDRMMRAFKKLTLNPSMNKDRSDFETSDSVS